ncbi:hypothetical protein LEP1GSC170_6133 [Leptospira interrogans serovar Bataviae str. HAI135]|nr:hypothetical protein LEP1GSC170_6133 [Leptospira interrogans serovar Bataviae str. HAI135]
MSYQTSYFKLWILLLFVKIHFLFLLSSSLIQSKATAF